MINGMNEILLVTKRKLYKIEFLKFLKMEFDALAVVCM